MVDGVIVPDLPVEEAGDFQEGSGKFWVGHDFFGGAIHHRLSGLRR